MSVEIRYNNLSNKDQAYEAVKSRVDEEMMRKFKVKAKVTPSDADKKIKAKGKGFELTLNFLEDKVVADISLSLLLRPLKSKINSELEKELGKVL